MHQSDCSSLPPRRSSLRSLVTIAAALFVAKARAECTELGRALLEHACFHVEYGPFVSVAANASENEPPTLDSPHTLYRLALPAVATYMTLREGQWAVLTEEQVSLALRDPRGEPVLPLITPRTSPHCPALPNVQVFELRAGTRYRVELGSNAVRVTPLAFEFLPDFEQEVGPDDDGDGAGRSKDAFFTSCAPPTGYGYGASDCDDQDPGIHPERSELCDGRDENCNGVVDDVGLRCRAGVGACSRMGTYQCDGPSQPVRCSADPGAPTEETCNDLDDDCDGAIDEQPSCSELDAPFCIREEGQASCGCLLDVDCGAAESGRVCNAVTRRCVAGCSLGPGGNACPASETCVVGDAAAQGRCELPPLPPVMNEDVAAGADVRDDAGMDGGASSASRQTLGAEGCTVGADGAGRATGWWAPFLLVLVARRRRT